MGLLPPKTKHKQVSVDEETQVAVKAYSGLTGVPQTKVLAEAVRDWMATIGKARLEALAAVSGQQGRVLMMPAPVEPLVAVQA